MVVFVYLEKSPLALVIIGALNWGLIGFFNYDLVAAIFGGSFTAGARIVYALVGLAGLVSPCAAVQERPPGTP